jgi:hypothetical protein
MLGREHEIKVRVDDDELAELDAMRNGVSRAAFVRSLIRKPPEIKDVASYEEALPHRPGPRRQGCGGDRPSTGSPRCPPGARQG